MKPAAAFLLVAVIAATCHAVTFELLATQKECLLEDIHSDVLVVGEYEITDGPAMKVDLEVSVPMPASGVHVLTAA